MRNRNGAMEEPRSEASVSREPKSEPVGAGARRLEAPTFYAATAQVLISGNDAILLFTRPHPAILPDGTLAPVPMRETVALVQMSLAAMKGLTLILSDVVKRVEQQTGEIHSEPTVHSNLAPPVANTRRSNGH
jgi:hypothetical protein